MPIIPAIDTSCSGDPAIAKEIEKYAEKLMQPGQYLDMVDAFLLAKAYGKRLMLVIDTNHHSLEPVCVEDYLKDYAKNILGYASTLAPLDSHGPKDTSSKHTALIVSCSATFEPMGEKNHWVPGFFEQQLSPDDWIWVTVTETRRIRALVREQFKALLEAEMGLVSDPSNDEKKAHVEQMRTERQILQNYLEFRCRSEKSGIGVLNVEGDGNCLLWSMRQLVVGVRAVSPEGTPEAHQDMMEMRKTIMESWKALKDDPVWQEMYKAFLIQGTHTPPRTDSKKSDSKSAQAMDLLTPPRPSPNAKRAKAKATAKADASKVMWVGQKRPAADKNVRIESSLLCPPPKKSKTETTKADEVAKEPDQSVPDHEMKVEDWQGDLLNVPLLDDPEPGKSRQKKSNHTRTGRKKIKSKAELEQDLIRHYLAGQGLTYHEWLAIHRRRCSIRKAGVCEGGGYLAMQAKLRQGDEVKCQSCLAAMETFQVDASAAKDVLSSRAGEACLEDIDPNPSQSEAKLTEDQEYQRSLEYVQKFAPIIELCTKTSKGYEIAFRCTVCKTKAQPEGKTNKLVKPKFKSTKHFLDQHLESATHIAKKLRWEKEQQSKMVKYECPGLCVNDCSALQDCLEEYRTWVTHTQLSGKTSEHNYWSDLVADRWFIRHKDCAKEFESLAVEGEESKNMCPKCSQLARPDSVKKLVSRFTFKMHGAVLLSKKLYGSEDEVLQYVDSFNSQTFGKRHCNFLSKIQHLSTAELQTYVRSSFLTTPQSRMTPAMATFVSTVVNPTLKVHVGTASADVPVFVEKFLAALQTGQLTEMNRVNLTIARAAATGRLDSNPFIQGLLLKCIRTMDRDERGASHRGRAGKASALEQALVGDAALTLFMAVGGNNKILANKLGQNVSAPRLFLDELPARSLPLPTLALSTSNAKQLEQNAVLIDQQFWRGPGMPAQRLFCGVDHTYLQKALTQISVHDRRGLVGGCWWPDHEEEAFMEFDSLPEDVSAKKKATLMLECLCWDPAAPHKLCFSLASQPMSLASRKTGDRENQGNWDACSCF